MPKDDSTPFPDGNVDVAKAPLKRGDACLYCRKRRIRCSATKPTCDHCKKLKRDCVYDSGKPVSRVKQLEDKVMELEEMLLQRASAVASGSSTAIARGAAGIDPGTGSHTAAMPSLPHVPPETSARSSVSHDNTAMNGIGGTFGMPSQQQSGQYDLYGSMNGSGSGPGAAFDAFPPMPAYTTNFFGSSLPSAPSASASLPFPLATSKAAEEIFDFSMLDPNFMSLVNSMSQAQTSSDSMDHFGSVQQSSMPPPANGVHGPVSVGMENELAGGMDVQLDTPALFALFNGDGETGDYFPTAPASSNLSASTAPMAAQHVRPDLATGLNSSSNDATGKTPSSPGSQTRFRILGDMRYQPSVATVPDDQDSSQPQSASQGLAAASDQSFPHAIGLSDDLARGFTSSTARVGNVGPNDTWDQESAAKRPLTGFNLSVSTGDPIIKPDPALEGLPLVGGWFDAADLPTVARDHLLDVFFSGMKVVGQEIHVPRFLASLSLPPTKRPHPCLLYTMYLLASRSSTHPPIRALESHFYSIALRKLEEAVAMADRLLDATRAATMLAVYKYGLARYHEGYMMVGMAARLAMSAGLHQIPSSVFRPAKHAFDRRADLGSLMRQRAYILGPPADAIELGERIWAFWALFNVDRCGSISAQWPSAIPDEIITTPYPRPLHEYELGLVSGKDDVSIMSVWQPPSLSTNRPPPLLYNAANGWIFHIRALSILERASKLMYLPPEPGWEAALRENPQPGLGGSGSAEYTPSPPGGLGFGWGSAWSPNQTIDDFLRAQNAAVSMMADSPMNGNGGGGGGGFGNGMSAGSGGGGTGGWTSQAGSGSGSGLGSTPSSWSQLPGAGPAAAGGALSDSGRGWTRCARVRTPKAYEQVHQALIKMESDLPPDRRTNWETWDGKLGSWLFDGKMRKEPLSLYFIIGCSWMFLFDVFSFTSDNTLSVNVARRIACTIQHIVQDPTWGEMDVFIAMIWSFVVKILIREAKRLHATGHHANAKPLESEVEIMVKALQTMGKRYNVASMQALRADRYRKSTAQETDFLKGDDYEDAVPQAG